MTTVLLACLAAWFALAPAALRRLDPLPHAASGAAPKEARFSTPALVGLSTISAVLTVSLIPGPVGALAGLGIAALVHFLLSRIESREDHRASRAELPEALDFLAVCLSAGSTSSDAVETVADVSPPATAALLRQVSAHLHVGRTPEEAWDTLRQHPIWGDAARDLARSARSGTSLVEVLQAHAEDARALAHDHQVKRARTAGVKSVLPLMVCFLPAFILIGVIPIIGALLQQFLQ